MAGRQTDAKIDRNPLLLASNTQSDLNQQAQGGIGFQQPPGVEPPTTPFPDPGTVHSPTPAPATAVITVVEGLMVKASTYDHAGTVTSGMTLTHWSGDTIDASGAYTPGTPVAVTPGLWLYWWDLNASLTENLPSGASLGWEVDYVFVSNGVSGALVDNLIIEANEHIPPAAPSGILAHYSAARTGVLGPSAVPSYWGFSITGPNNLNTGTYVSSSDITSASEMSFVALRLG